MKKLVGFLFLVVGAILFVAFFSSMLNMTEEEIRSTGMTQNLFLFAGAAVFLVVGVASCLSGGHGKGPYVGEMSDAIRKLERKAGDNKISDVIGTS